MKINQIFNFSSGPSMLPIEVLNRIKMELYNWNNIGLSVMEISHRSKEFIKMTEIIEQDLRDLLNIPKNYKILFCHGGARAQFSAIPMNLINKTNSNADYINGGYWSYSAIKEAKKYCSPTIINIKYKYKGLLSFKPINKWKLSNSSTYIHYCPNETIDGSAINELPNFKNKIIVGDFSSIILSRPLKIENFGIIYAGAQKNIGPAGITLVIIREDLLKKSKELIPSVLNYKIISNSNSMFNTPPTFAWYVSGLVFNWLKTQGGLLEFEKRNKIKSNLLYDVIDNNDFYYNNISPLNRSLTNVTFHLSNNKLNTLFLKESEYAGLYSLKGHTAVGGMRASLYNAMPLEGVKILVDFMKEFSRKYG